MVLLFHSSDKGKTTAHELNIVTYLVQSRTHHQRKRKQQDIIVGSGTINRVSLSKTTIANNEKVKRLDKMYQVIGLVACQTPS